MTLEKFFETNNRLALAFSGGVDSAYLLYAGLHYGADIGAYYLKSQFQPEFEYEDALRLADGLGAKLKVIDLDVLGCKEVAANPPDRCYHCKSRIMAEIKRQAARDGYKILIDGTNASDDASDRPGMRALREIEVLSPLRLCGLRKSDIRSASKAAGLFTWDKPAYACLATRIPSGEEISAEKLYRIEQGEKALFVLGYSDFRLRLRKSAALLQLVSKQRERALADFAQIEQALSGYFDEIIIDEEERKEST